MDSTLITLIKNSSIIFDLTVLNVFDSIINCNLCYLKIYYNSYRYGIKQEFAIACLLVLTAFSNTKKTAYQKVL